MEKEKPTIIRIPKFIDLEQEFQIQPEFDLEDLRPKRRGVKGKIRINLTRVYGQSDQMCGWPWYLVVSGNVILDVVYNLQAKLVPGGDDGKTLRYFSSEIRSLHTYKWLAGRKYEQLLDDVLHLCQLYVLGIDPKKLLADYERRDRLNRLVGVRDRLKMTIAHLQKEIRDYNQFLSEYKAFIGRPNVSGTTANSGKSDSVDHAGQDQRESADSQPRPAGRRERR